MSNDENSLVFSSQHSCLRTVDRKDLIQALSPYLDDVQNLGNIIYDYVGKPFISTWQLGGKYKHKIALPLESDGKYNFSVDWGDGRSDQITSFDQAETSHEYKEAGRYIVQLNGVVNGFAFSDMTGSWPEPRPSCRQIVDISQWGCLGLSPQGRQFTGCVNLNCSAQDSPNLASVTSFESMFEDCERFNGDVSGWNTAACTNMTRMFQCASSFNADLSGWNTAACTNVRCMFYNASSFNGDLSGWNTAACTNMSFMFEGASSFNGDVSG